MHKRLYSIAIADKNLKHGNRHGRDLTFQGRTFERLYKEGKEIYRHWTEAGAELKDMGDFIANEPENCRIFSVANEWLQNLITNILSLSKEKILII